jgi:hypothetical protein
MPPAGFEPTISAGERAQTYDLDRTATGTFYATLLITNSIFFFFLIAIESVKGIKCRTGQEERSETAWV